MIRRSLWAVGIGLLATGFVRQTTTEGTPIGWSTRCPLLEIGALDPDGVTEADLRDSLERAITEWQASGCDSLPFQVSATATSEGETVLDGRNLVVTRPASYCDDQAHADADVCLSPGTLALTTLYYIDRPGDPHNGDIVEADLEINAAYNFARDGEPGAYDLDSVVTHELGHVLGLAHTCTTEPGAHLVDPAGRTVPACINADTDASHNDTMYPWVFVGESKRRTLEADEREAICVLYGSRPRSCEADPIVAGYTCNTASSETSAIVGMALVLVLSRRRRPSYRIESR